MLTELGLLSAGLLPNELISLVRRHGSGLTEAVITDMTLSRLLTDVFDLDGNGALPPHCLATHARALCLSRCVSLPLSPSLAIVQVPEIPTRCVVVSGSGLISFDEFRAILHYRI